MSLKPGNIVEIDTDSPLSQGSPLKALIYDVTGKRLILSQTSPPLPPSSAEQTVHLSYLVKEGSSSHRYSVAATVTGYGHDYRLSSGVRVPTIIVEITQQPKEISLRKGFRVRPPRDGGISLTIGGKVHPIFDISVSGISFIQNLSQPPLRSADTLECLLQIDGTPYPVEARVARVTQTRTARQVAAVFTSMGKDLEPLLSRKILMLEREERIREG